MLETTSYGLRVELHVPYQQAIHRVISALKAEGFGVLTQIDVQETLKQKLNREFWKCVVLGACNPTLADRALHVELEIGAALSIVGKNAALDRLPTRSAAPPPATHLTASSNHLPNRTTAR